VLRSGRPKMTRLDRSPSDGIRQAYGQPDAVDVMPGGGV
jgi:hypothetical protein